jgi:hypothetical protein
MRKRRTDDGATGTSRELEQLLERIRDGTIGSSEDLDDAALALLRRHYGSAEEIEALLDRLRGPDRGAG